MNLITILSNNSDKGWKILKESLDKRGWNTIPIVVEQEKWKGNTIRPRYLFDYLTNSKIDRFVFSDAYDVLCLGTPEEFTEKLSNFNKTIIISAEKNCHPDSDKRSLYPVYNSKWKYINAGLIYIETALFFVLYEKYKPFLSGWSDQRWWTRIFLENTDRIDIDINNILFQSLYMEEKDDFNIRDGRLYNTITKTTPIFAHGNGKSNIGKLYALS